MVWSHQFKSRCVQRSPAASSILSSSTCVKKLPTNEKKSSTIEAKLPTNEGNHDFGDAHDVW